MPPEKQQFRCLFRCLLGRFLNNELVSSSGDIREAITHVLALVFALGMCVMFMLAPKYMFYGFRRPDVRNAMLWTDQEMMISLGLAVAGVAVVLFWDALFPDLTDALALGPLPVRMRTIYAAKLSATATLFFTLTLALNSVPGIVFPMVLSDLGVASLPRAFAAQAIATGAGTLFVFAAAIAIQGVLMNLLPYRCFRRISAWAQLLLLFAVLFVFFLEPVIARIEDLVRGAPPAAMWWLPAYWFLGVYHVLMGTNSEVFTSLAAHGGVALVAALVLAAAMHRIGYTRYVRRTVEDSGMVSAGARERAIGTGAPARSLLPDSIERAVFRFTLRTLTRSRMHRLIVAVCAGLGLCWTLIDVAQILRAGGLDALRRVDVHVSSVPIVLSFFLLLGMRIAFTVPSEVKANWLFRITEDPESPAYLAGIRKLMFAAGVAPLAMVSLPAYAALWGWPVAARHALLVALIGWVVIESFTGAFRKIPFTCSYVPGKADLKVRFALYATFFAMISAAVSNLELFAIRELDRFLWIAGITTALAAVLAYRRRANALLQTGFIYDDRPDWQVITLELT